jgi:hypothetical protein
VSLGGDHWSVWACSSIASYGRFCPNTVFDVKGLGNDRGSARQGLGKTLSTHTGARNPQVSAGRLRELDPHGHDDDPRNRLRLASTGELPACSRVAFTDVPCRADLCPIGPQTPGDAGMPVAVSGSRCRKSRGAGCRCRDECACSEGASLASVPDCGGRTGCDRSRGSRSRRHLPCPMDSRLSNAAIWRTFRNRSFRALLYRFAAHVKNARLPFMWSPRR